jgi:predicted transcriptional regulator
MEDTNILKQQCKIHIKREGKDLFYTGMINKITDTHIHFTDKFGSSYIYKMVDVVQICSI